MQYRACSLCIIRRRDSILLEQFPEEDGVITFRPVGGTIEYGEDSRSAVIREVKEEINIDIIEPHLLGVIEHIFSWYGEIGHEYDFIYEASFSRSDDYNRNEFEGIEGDKRFLAVWKNLDDFKDNPQYKLVPDGLYEMLTSGQISDIKHINTKELSTFKESSLT
ncbi:NUDIX domain-containing protein [Paenibacillus sp. PR3]|uniref:NUDIX domain-containing protein n=1 Tax=Paenibacillus terricola TaxID=2763503 RepID=A0ABR8N0I1_9BACL|nr:NUDIX domain-containing protein [Paenibacillus terricola]MBD3921699.1 NUDIX domain-containing protein [Paenibacillus terricola]